MDHRGVEDGEAAADVGTFEDTEDEEDLSSRFPFLSDFLLISYENLRFAPSLSRDLCATLTSVLEEKCTEDARFGTGSCLT